MKPLFDSYMMVDWSAASKPVLGGNSIWIAVLSKGQLSSTNLETRLKARAFIIQKVRELTKNGGRVLIGFDFSLGYPAGTAAALKLDLKKKKPWQAMHHYLASTFTDTASNANSRFLLAASMNNRISKGSFPFWGRPNNQKSPKLKTKKPNYTKGPLEEYRHIEKYLREKKLGQPKSCWQLFYIGSVGSQSLTGIPHVHALRKALPKSRIWPFEFRNSQLSGKSLNETRVVISEIYPSLVRVKAKLGETLDEAQVKKIALHYRNLDKKGQLGASLTSKDTKKMKDIVIEEGWILGI
jgi:hypothetical protein